MSGIIAAAVKESMGKVVEKAKETKSILENTNLPEVKEVVEVRKKVVQEVDIETAKNSSLSSLLEDNKEKQEIEEKKSNELDEGKEGQEGLTDEEKTKLRELTGWSDEILDAISSWEEAEIYMKAGLKEVEINGKNCLIRDDIDLDQKDEDGITNRERMERGRPPITKEGQEVELHHIGQKQDSPLAELTTEQHRGVGNDTILHDKTKETEIDRNEFGKERRDHWKGRVGSIEGGE
ncbi:MAG: HNH/ENDO VII family nuclease [Blautia sp.]|nr:HNH/ENDO VII family nuclease [Blautia sp.]